MKAIKLLGEFPSVNFKISSIPSKNAKNSIIQRFVIFDGISHCHIIFRIDGIKHFHKMP